MRTIAFDDQQHAALHACATGSTNPIHLQRLRDALRTAGWRDPQDVPAQYHSRPTEAVLVLVLLHDQRPDARLGYYTPGMGWRAVGYPPAAQPRAWMPLPATPATLPWEA